MKVANEFFLGRTRHGQMGSIGRDPDLNVLQDVRHHNVELLVFWIVSPRARPLLWPVTLKACLSDLWLNRPQGLQMAGNGPMWPDIFCSINIRLEFCRLLSFKEEFNKY